MVEKKYKKNYRYWSLPLSARSKQTLNIKRIIKSLQKNKTKFERVRVLTPQTHTLYHAAGIQDGKKREEEEKKKIKSTIHRKNRRFPCYCYCCCCLLREQIIKIKGQQGKESERERELVAYKKHVKEELSFNNVNHTR